MAQQRPMFYKGQNQTLDIGRPKKYHMRVIQSNENTLKRNFLDDSCTTNHNTTNCDEQKQEKE